MVLVLAQIHQLLNNVYLNSFWHFPVSHKLTKSSKVVSRKLINDNDNDTEFD